MEGPVSTTGSTSSDVAAAGLVSYLLSPALSSKVADGPTTSTSVDNTNKKGSSTAVGSAGDVVVDGAEHLERIRGAQQTTIANLSSASAKITHMTQESDRLLQASMVTFQNHVMTMSRVQADLSALQGRIAQCVGRAERIRAADEKLLPSRRDVTAATNTTTSKTEQTPTSSPPPQVGKEINGDGSGAAEDTQPIDGTAAAVEGDAGVIDNTVQSKQQLPAAANEDKKES